MGKATPKQGILVLLAAVTLAACGADKGPFGLAARAGSPAGATRIVEREVEAPEVFQRAEDGAWDGRPSLGGVWVAHASATDPERVIIRNEATGKFVIGALFRREKAGPGTPFQVSADAAAALGMSANEPQVLVVTALMRENAVLAAQDPSFGETSAPPQAAGTTALPQGAGSTALPQTAESASPAKTGDSAAQPKSAPPALANPYVQIGIFSVQQNAERAAAEMRAAGLEAALRKSDISGKVYWRVLVGPATTEAVRAKNLTKVKTLGYSDSYAVKG